MAILGKLKGIIASACEPSRNGRKYTEHFWDEKFNSDMFQEGIKNKMFFGNMYHPEGEAYEQIHIGDESAVLLTEVEKKGLNYIGTFDILPTRSGEILKNLVDIGCVFGISSRGLNDYDTPVFDDPSTFDLITFDVVAFPGIKSARLHPVTAIAESFSAKRKINRTKIMENLNRLANEDKQAKKFINDTLKTKESIDKSNNKIKESVLTVTIQEVEKFIEDAKRQFPGSTAFYDGDTNTIKIELNNLVAVKEDFDTELQIDDTFDNDDYKKIIYSVETDENGEPYFNDLVHGKHVVFGVGEDRPKTNLTKNGLYFVDYLYWNDDKNAYVALGDWLEIK